MLGDRANLWLDINGDKCGRQRNPRAMFPHHICTGETSWVLHWNRKFRNIRAGERFWNTYIAASAMLNPIYMLSHVTLQQPCEAVTAIIPAFKKEWDFCGIQLVSGRTNTLDTCLSIQTHSITNILGSPTMCSTDNRNGHTQSSYSPSSDTINLARDMGKGGLRTKN